MSRIVVTVESVRVSGADRGGGPALARGLEGAVVRALQRTPPRPLDASRDVPVIRLQVDNAATVGADPLGAAVADAITAAVQGRSAKR